MSKRAPVRRRKSAEASDLILTRAKPARVAIVVAKSPREGLAKFAELLQRRIRQAMGRKTPIVAESAAKKYDIAFHVGPTAACRAGVPEQRKLPPHGFIVRSDGKANVFFAAHDDYAVGFGVVEFLDKVMNCRQYMPAPLGECITRTDRLVIPAGLNLVQDHPAFESVFFSGLCPESTEESTPPFKEMEIALQLYRSDEFTHNFHNIIPVEKYGKEHPEWYPMIKGARRVASGPAGSQAVFSGWQPCLSNAAFFERAVEYCGEYFDEFPESTCVSMAVNDGNGWCLCDECKKAGGQWPGRWDLNLYYDFVNRIAKRLQKLRPGKRVAMLAYGMAVSPPPFKLEKNLLVYKVHPDEAPTKGFKPWSDLGASTAVYSWIYGYNHVTPRYYPHMFAKIIKRWLADGPEGFYGESYTNWIIDAPMLYAQAKILRNPDVDADALLRQFAVDMYGEGAAGGVIAFFQAVETAMERRAHQRTVEDDFTHLSTLGRALRYQFDCWRPEDVEKMDAALAEAGKGIKPGTLFAQRLELLQTWWNGSRQYILTYTLAEKVRTAGAATPGDVEKLLPAIGRVDEHRAAIPREWHQNVRDAAPAERALYLRSPLTVERWGVEVGPWIEPRNWACYKVDEGLTRASAALVKSMGKEKAIAFWSGLADKHPAAAAYLRTQASLLRESPENLIDNGSFEKVDPFTLGNRWVVPEGFVLWNGHTNAVIEDMGVDETVVHSPGRSWRSGRGNAGWLDRTLSVTPGARYLVSVWVRQTNTANDARLNLVIYHKTGQARDMIYNPRDASVVKPNEWYQLRTILTVPELCDKLSIALVASNKNDGDVTWFDDLHMARLC